MKRVLKRSTINEFIERHPQSKIDLLSWYQIMRNSTYSSFDEITSSFPYSRYVSKNRIIFKIKGNNYRLIATFNFKLSVVRINFIGTHAEYDKYDSKTIEKY